MTLTSEQMAEGVLPVELPNHKTMSMPVATKKHMEPKKAQTLPMGSKTLSEPSFGGRGQIEKETVTNDATVSEGSGDSDSEVERKRIALFEAMEKKARRKKDKAKTMDDILPRPNQKREASDHLHQAPSPRVTASPPLPWMPPSPFSSPTFAMPTMGSPSAMSPPPGSHDSGNVTLNVTTDSYNDNSIHHTVTTVTKRGMIKFSLSLIRFIDCIHCRY